MICGIRNFFLGFLILCSACVSAQQKEFSFNALFSKYPESFDSIISNKEKYRLQIIYTKVDRDSNNFPHLKTYTLDADKYYYYCASLIKFPAAVLTLEKLNDLNAFHLSRNDSIGIDTIFCDDLNIDNLMLSSKNPCMAQFIKEIFLVSNNKAFNPLYDFLGQKYFSDRMRALGYSSAVITNRFSACDTFENRKCNPVSFYERGSGQFKFQQPCVINETQPLYDGGPSPLVGDAFLGDGMLNKRPKDFSYMNYLKLSDFHSLLTKIIFPKTQIGNERLRLHTNDYTFLKKCMGMFPSESAYPIYDSINYPDHYMKYFVGLDSGCYKMPENIRVFNKVGQAYGFMSDCSYVQDTLNKVEFFLSCSMYLNADGILNDGKYEYDQTGYPFFHNLFNAIYEEELLRKKQHLPKFENINFTDSTRVSFKNSAVYSIDTNQSAEKMETELCVLADSMWNSKKYFFSNEDEKTESLFVENLLQALTSSKFSGYLFEKLRTKKILISFSEKKDLIVFSWNSKNAILRFTDAYGNVFLKNMRSKDLPKLSYNTAFRINNSPSSIFILVGITDEKLNNSEYIQAYGLVEKKIEKLRIFKMGENLFSDILVESSGKNSQVKYNGKHSILSFPMIIKEHGKTSLKITKLKFDGTVFKN